MRNDMTDPKLTHFTLFEAFSDSNEKDRVYNSIFFKGLAKAGERIRTADVQLGKPIVVPQLLIHTYVTARFFGHFEGFNWFASH